MSLKEDATPIVNLAESLLASISEIMTAVVCIEKEHENFIEFGCYLYRASLAIMELLKAENSPENAIEILQTLSLNVDLAKDLVKRCQEIINTISDNEQGSIIAQLEGVINHTGESLSLIPSSTFGDQEYVKVAIWSLSNEMQNAQFGIGQTLAVKTKQHDTRTLSLEKQLKEEPAPQETDLYPINVDVSINDHQFLNMPQKIEALRSTSSDITRKPGNLNRSLTTLPQATQYMEPLYETFFCPLGKKIMDNPVTIETGVTYERNEITKWFEKFEKSDIFCPVTGQKLVSRAFNTNKALKSTIEEWLERNEASRIKVARTALSLASSKDMVLEAIKDLQTICQRKRYNKVQVRSVGLMPSLIKFLGEIVLGHDSKTFVAVRASPHLVKMVQSGNSLSRTAAFKALAQISSYQPNAKILVEAGVVKIMVEEMFSRRIYDEPMNSKIEAAAILANIFESELELEKFQVNNHGHTITSDYVVYSIFDMLKNSTPDKLNINLIRIILCLTKTQKSIATIVSVVKTTEASHTLTELINNPHDDLAITAIKLLCTLSPYMGHTLAERLCKTGGQPESLIQSPTKFLSFGSSKRRKLPGCPVHRGACSSKNTFCLVDAKAVERLLACLDHENVEVVEAALSAIITLLDEKVDVDNSVSMLSEVNAVQRVLNLVKEHQQEGLWQKSLWVIDKFLMKGGDKSASDISQDRLLPATLVNAFHHGDGNTREMAEKILRHLNKMPNSATSNYTM